MSVIVNRITAFVSTAVILAALSICAGPSAWAADRKVEQRAMPSYPEMAKKMKISGVVKVALTVAADGHVASAKAQSGNMMLVLAAEQAGLKYKFAPGDESTEIIEIHFVIE
jgi:TonB family protein